MESKTEKRIDSEDMKSIERLAEKYGTTPVKFASKFLQQSSLYRYYYVRFSDEEHGIIKQRAKAAGISYAQYCEICCNRFVEDLNQQPFDLSVFRGIKQRNHESDKVRKRVVNTRLMKGSTRKRLEQIGTEYNLKMATMIRLCFCYEERRIEREEKR